MTEALSGNSYMTAKQIQDITRVLHYNMCDIILRYFLFNTTFDKEEIEMIQNCFSCSTSRANIQVFTKAKHELLPHRGSPV